MRSLVSDVFFFLMIRRPPRSTLDRSSAASDVYKRQVELESAGDLLHRLDLGVAADPGDRDTHVDGGAHAVSYTHLRAHETVLDLVCRLLLEKKKRHTGSNQPRIIILNKRHDDISDDTSKQSCQPRRHRH